MVPDTRNASFLPVLFLAAIAFFLALSCAPALAANAEIEAYMGDTVTISGVSYISDEMYLFMTGKDLDANGVTLTDTSALASKGDFTMVDVDSDQTWSYSWDTSRISRSIDPGVYTVYASTEPVDVAHLGSSDTYKTVDVWLKDAKTAPHVSSGSSYSLNPEEHVSTPDITLVFTPTPAPTTPPATVTATQPAPMNTTAAVTPPPTAVATTTRSGFITPVIIMTLVAGFAGGLILVRNRAGKR